MAISTLDGYIGASKQVLRWNKTATRTTVASIPFSLFDLAGTPGAGTLTAGNTGNGTLPTDSIAGYPVIEPITGTGYLSRLFLANTVSCRIAVYDTLFAAGAYTFNADTTLTGAPSYSARVPGGDYKGTELWIEAVTAFTGNQTVQINYLDEGGAAGDTGAIATAVAPTIGRMLRLPLASGDNGVSGISRVRSSVSTVGTFNVLVMRKLYEARIVVANGTVERNWLDLGGPIVYDTSALRIVIYADSTSSGLPTCDMEIAQG